MKYLFLILGMNSCVAVFSGCFSNSESADKTRAVATIAEYVEAVHQAETARERDDAALKLAQELSTASKDRIATAGRKQVLTTLREVLSESESPKVRAKVAEGLGIAKDVDSTRALVQAMVDDSTEVRAAAGEAIKRILGIDFGFRADAPNAERSKAADRYRAYYETQVVGSNLEAVLRGERDMKEFEDDARRRSEALRNRWPK